MTIQTIRTNKTNAAVVIHEWSAADAKGRVIGLQIRTNEVDLVPMTAETGCFYRIPAGHYFVANMQTTKDGQVFGACQPDQYFATAEERAAAIVKRLSAAMKKTGTI